ncbi:ABC transporter substrate-binding protein [Parapusillimonas granuli]|uniref:ABC transporter substrate-binding protein n=1 Tax=Parapusillimonas granuli TaxID=380911 RepID=A0A853FZ91_9BURK|nr:ABC-type branched-subunit amino acid transport system substrate-binding protein [Parapusillimonas granuli]MEB2399124.1 ABC transporter substrate-binding protein [Alcaligenaceae bacterium]NYT51415.1 ABC transporter substrate-binding protein [Parapusillimonas granuli]
MHRRTFLSGCAAAASLALPGLVRAQQPAPGIDTASKTVTVGAFTPITGPVPFYAILTHAAESCFKWANETNALDGWKIKFVTYDDGYEPARSVAVTRRLVGEDKIFALTAPVGTAQSVAVIPYAKEVGLPMIGPIGGATALFSERLVFPLLPDYGWSAASNLDYAVKDLKSDRVALLWENDELGRSAKRGFDMHMKTLGKEPAESIPFEVRNTDFTPHLRRIANAKAQTVILFGSNANLAAALKAADRLGFKSNWMAPFFTADPTTYKLAGPLLDGVYFSSWLVPVTADDPQIKAYRDSVSKHYPNDPIGVFGLNGWSNASLFVKGFKSLLGSGKPLTRESLVDVMETMRNETVGGARGVSFEKGDHRGARQEGIIRAGEGGKFVLVRDFKPYPAEVFNAKVG